MQHESLRSKKSACYAAAALLRVTVAAVQFIEITNKSDLLPVASGAPAVRAQAQNSRRQVDFKTPPASQCVAPARASAAIENEQVIAAPAVLEPRHVVHAQTRDMSLERMGIVPRDQGHS